MDSSLSLQLIQTIFDDFFDYRIRRGLVPLNDLHFPKFVRGLDNGDFYFSICFFIYNFYTKKQLGGFMIITLSYLNRKTKANRRFSSK